MGALVGYHAHDNSTLRQVASMPNDPLNLRVRIWAAVSSMAQAADDRTSLHRHFQP
jgi:hypothetical protein